MTMVSVYFSTDSYNSYYFTCNTGEPYDIIDRLRLSGRYAFSKVLPGNYEITASHASWTLERVNPNVFS